MGECLDVEAQGWAYAHDVFTIELLQDCRLACIVKAKEEDAHLLLLLAIFPYNSEQAHQKVEQGDVNP